MRGAKAFAATVGVGALGAVAAAVAFAVFGHAVADQRVADDDEIIRTAPETIPDLTVEAPAVTETAQTGATRTATSSEAAEWAQASGRAAGDLAQAGAHGARAWVAPRIQQAEALVDRYQLETRVDPREQRTETRVQVALGRDGDKKDVPALVARRLGVNVASSSDFKGRGRWFLFAAGSDQAVGLNMLRGRDGELRRAGWSAERIAAIGDGQAGVGWRKGPLQASFAFVEREISAYGKSVDQKFMAFTLSIKPESSKRKGPKSVKASPYMPYQPSWTNYDPETERNRR